MPKKLIDKKKDINFLKYTPEYVPIKISAKSMNQKYADCDVEHIKTVCHGKCCRSNTKNNTKTILLPEEISVIELLGGVVKDSWLIFDEDTHSCPFLNEWGGCTLHFTDFKPYACLVHPLTLTNRDTLILSYYITNRKVCREGKRVLPAYLSFSQCLIGVFGKEGAKKIQDRLYMSNEDFIYPLERERYIKFRRYLNHLHLSRKK